MLKNIHENGYIYNDLKLDNILTGFQNKLPSSYSENNCFEQCQLHLVDFGFATKYIDKATKKHVEPQEIGTFRGNMIFASANQLNFQMTSRRDDLISLSYVLIYLLNNGNLQGIDLSSNMSRNESFIQAKNAKENISIEDTCSRNAKCILEFVKAVHRI